jgi:hypothetical protein
MAKKVKTNNKVSVDSPIPFPQVHTFDELAVIDDDSLGNMQRVLSDSIARVNGHGLNPSAWEVEMCYVQRELQIRVARREAHAKYVSTFSVVEED